MSRINRHRFNILRALVGHIRSARGRAAAREHVQRQEDHRAGRRRRLTENVTLVSPAGSLVNVRREFRVEPAGNLRNAPYLHRVDLGQTVRLVMTSNGVITERCIAPSFAHDLVRSLVEHGHEVLS